MIFYIRFLFESQMTMTVSQNIKIVYIFLTPIHLHISEKTTSDKNINQSQIFI